MRILVVTQKVDKNDSILGFFHRWLEEFAQHFEQVTVVCLGQGQHDLPSNVKVLSLGKEKLEIENSKLKIKFRYLLNFYTYIWQERSNYDAVFVHMNQEYVLLAGDLWRIMGKKVFLWRNHAKGTLLTDLAAWLSHKVFYTSPQSYTAKFKNAVQMPVGIDTDFFRPDPRAVRQPNSVLVLGRIAPVKKTLECVEWFNSQPPEFSATVAGEATPKDKAYEALVRKIASDRIKFVGPVTQEEALSLYQTHELYVNKTPAGSFDKTIIEAAACGMKLLVDNPAAENLEVEEQSLKRLMGKLMTEISI